MNRTLSSLLMEARRQEDEDPRSNENPRAGETGVFDSLPGLGEEFDPETWEQFWSS